MQSTKHASIKQEIIDNIKAFDTIIIHRHQRPDPDAIGSQTGLRSLIHQAYPEKNVFAVGNDLGDLDFLSELDTISDDVYEDALVIVTDTANEPRIHDRRYRLGKKMIKIDHHPENREGNYASLIWVDDSYSSCSEMISELSLDFPEDLPMNDEAARVLYAGMVADTNRFLYDATDRKTMEIAGQLMEYDFNHTELIDHMNSMTIKEAGLVGYTMNNLNILPSGAAYLMISRDMLDEWEMTSDQTSAIVSLPRNIEGVQAWIIFVQETETRFRARIRSKGPIINELAQKYGGGGHKLASGANAFGEQEVQDMIKELDELVKSYS